MTPPDPTPRPARPPVHASDEAVYARPPAAPDVHASHRTVPLPPPERCDLLPRQFVIDKLTRRKVRGWVGLGSMYVALLGLACAAVRIATAPTGPSPTAELERLAALKDENTEQLARHEVQLRGVRARLESRKSLALQPDFSLMLELLSTCVDADAALRQIQFRSTGVAPVRTADTFRPDAPASPTPAAPRVPAPPPAAQAPGSDREPRYFTLYLRGVSSTEGGISRLTARLRDLKLFDDVELTRTGRDNSATSDRQAISFEIVCQIYEPSAPAPAQAPAPSPLAGGTP